MPQLVLTDFTPQLIWLAITFIGLYLFMSRVAIPRIANVIEQRQDRISRDLDEAEKLKKETENALAAYEQSMAEARAKAHAIAQENRDKLHGEIDAERQAVEQKISEKMAEAENRIKASKESALSEINAIAGETAGSIVEALIGKQVDKSEIDKIVAQEAQGN